MKEFFLILFLSKSVLLTSNGIDVFGGWVQVPLKEPLEAITSGACMFVDVSSYVGPDLSLKTLGDVFPRGMVTARLVRPDGRETLLTSISGYSTQSGGTYLILESKQGVPTFKEFSQLYVRSNKELKGTKLIWRNYQK